MERDNHELEGESTAVVGPEVGTLPSDEDVAGNRLVQVRLVGASANPGALIEVAEPFIIVIDRAVEGQALPVEHGLPASWRRWTLGEEDAIVHLRGEERLAHTLRPDWCKVSAAIDIRDLYRHDNRICVKGHGWVRLHLFGEEIVKWHGDLYGPYCLDDTYEFEVGLGEYGLVKLKWVVKWTGHHSGVVEIEIAWKRVDRWKRLCYYDRRFSA